MDERGKILVKGYDIDSNDYFWAKNAGNPFPQVAEDVDSEINRYKAEVDQVTKTAGVKSLDDVDPKYNISNYLVSSMQVLKTYQWLLNCCRN